MKNGSIEEQIQMQEGMNAFTNSCNHEVSSSLTHELNDSLNHENNQSNNISGLGLFDMEQHGVDYEAVNFAKCKKMEEKRRRGMRR